MGKKSKKKSKFRDLNYSDIGDHTRKGKKLVAPFNSLPMMSQSSWRDDHAPEMLWAILLAETFPREDYLACYREIVSWCRQTFPVSEGQPTGVARQPLPEASPLAQKAEFNPACELDHTSLSELSDENFAAFVSIPLRYPFGYAALIPLLLIESLPGAQRWLKKLAAAPTERDWVTLGRAVVGTLDHQSEKSTDVRWLKYVLKIVLQKIHFAGANVAETARLILRFPAEGDMRTVRPLIRAGEMMFRRQPPLPWIEQYWREVFNKTACADSSTEDEYLQEAKTTIRRVTIVQARMNVVGRFRSTVKSTRTDSRLDACYGFVLHSLALLEEIAGPPMPRMLVGRMALRSIAEAVITFSYLLKKDDPALWTAYRVHGAGQAKLAFLKMEEAAGDKPKYVDQETLYAIANEDMWQEFLDVDLGHWAGMNLRDLAIQGDTKGIYDRYYNWTSAVSHAQWCAVRDSNFATCYNPLHRLHRIPRISHRLLPTVVTDGVALSNRTLDLLEGAYPKMLKMVRLAELAQPEREMPAARPKPSVAEPAVEAASAPESVPDRQGAT